MLVPSSPTYLVCLRPALRGSLHLGRSLRFLNKRLDELQVVDRPPDDTSKVRFGAWVTLEDEDGGEKRWRIVGPDEFDLALGKLSMDSPMARALLGKGLDVFSPRDALVSYAFAVYLLDRSLA